METEVLELRKAIEESQRLFCSSVGCIEKTAMRDTLGLHWCAEHQFRGELLNAGAARGWPALTFYRYALASWVHSWFIMALTGSEECVLLAQEAIAEWDLQKQRDTPSDNLWDGRNDVSA
jgi:hypothetical protein